MNNITELRISKMDWDGLQWIGNGLTNYRIEGGSARLCLTSGAQIFIIGYQRAAAADTATINTPEPQTGPEINN